MSETITKINETVKAYNMLHEGDTVVVGVSGGADSMFLLNYLYNEKAYDLIVAHVEHGIRGEASKADCEFVKSYCEKLGIRFELLGIDAPNEAKSRGMGVEEYSRIRRYEFFNSFCADKIAVAHNADDSIETMLFRLARGTSIKGLAGIPPVRDNIIRPLIDVSSAEIRAACKEQGIPYVVDETNSDNAYSRNYIRNELIPAIEKLNPAFDDAAKRLMQSCAEDNAFITKCALSCIDECKTDGGLDISRLRKYGIAVIKRVIVILSEEYGVTPDALHLTQALELLENN